VSVHIGQSLNSGMGVNLNELHVESIISVTHR